MRRKINNQKQKAKKVTLRLGRTTWVYPSFSENFWPSLSKPFLNLVKLKNFGLWSLGFWIFFSFPFPVYAQGFSLKDAYGFGEINSLAEGIGRLIIPAFTLAAVAVIFYFLLGAFQYITSAGDKNKIQTARGKIIHAIIGFILLIAMFFILQILPELFGLGGFVLIS